jgi:uncharacterized protein YdhG (YjbR/CyaY superfamily)
MQVILEKVRQTIRKAVPEATETMSYTIPTFDLNGIHLIFFAGWEQSLSVYPHPAGDEAFQQAKSTLRFPLNKPVPYELREQLALFLMREKSETEH